MFANHRKANGYEEYEKGKDESPLSYIRTISFFVDLRQIYKKHNF